jgi:hypothetical protein
MIRIILVRHTSYNKADLEAPSSVIALDGASKSSSLLNNLGKSTFGPSGPAVFPGPRTDLYVVMYIRGIRTLAED